MKVSHLENLMERSRDITWYSHCEFPMKEFTETVFREPTSALIYMSLVEAGQRDKSMPESPQAELLILGSTRTFGNEQVG